MLHGEKKLKNIRQIQSSKLKLTEITRKLDKRLEVGTARGIRSPSITANANLNRMPKLSR